MLRKLYTTFMFSILLLHSNLKADCIFEQGIQTKELGIGIMMTWSTSEETENGLFIIEKSDAGSDYVNVGTVKGSGNSRALKNYNFLDARASSAVKAYYRLKIVDFDGTFSYSEITLVNRKLVNNLAIVQMSSETTTRLFSCAIDAFTEGSAALKLVNSEGKTVWENTQTFTNGLNAVTLDMSSQKEGTYKLVIALNKEEETLVLRKSLDEVEKKINVASNRRALGPNR